MAMCPLPGPAASNNILRGCHNFNLRRYTSGGVIAERVNTVETRHKHHAAFASDFRIRAHSSAPELSPVLKTSTSRPTGRDILPSCISTYRNYKLKTRLSELPSTLRSLNVWLPCL